MKSVSRNQVGDDEHVAMQRQHVTPMLERVVPVV
jgi:hypothetical protein